MEGITLSYRIANVFSCVIDFACCATTRIDGPSHFSGFTTGAVYVTYEPLFANLKLEEPPVFENNSVVSDSNVSRYIRRATGGISVKNAHAGMCWAPPRHPSIWICRFGWMFTCIEAGTPCSVILQGLVSLGASPSPSHSLSRHALRCLSGSGSGSRQPLVRRVGSRPDYKK